MKRVSFHLWVGNWHLVFFFLRCSSLALITSWVTTFFFFFSWATFLLSCHALACQAILLQIVNMQHYKGSGRLLLFELKSLIKGIWNILHVCVPQNLLEMMKAWTETLEEKGRKGHSWKSVSGSKAHRHTRPCVSSNFRTGYVKESPSIHLLDRYFII